MSSSKEGVSTNAKIVIAIVVALIASFAIPFKAWSGDITGGYHVLEGCVLDANADQLLIEFKSAPAVNGGLSYRGSTLVLEGEIRDNCRQGQSVRIGFKQESVRDVLNKNVEVSFYEDTNLFNGVIFRSWGFRPVAGKMKLVNVDPNGNKLYYYIAADHHESRPY